MKHLINRKARAEHLFQVMTSERFLTKQGLGNEVPFFIYPYDPEDALAVGEAKKRVRNKLKNDHGVTVLEINLYDLTVEMLEKYFHTRRTAGYVNYWTMKSARPLCRVLSANGVVVTRAGSIPK